jgi:hypothetical protein
MLVEISKVDPLHAMKGAWGVRRRSNYSFLTSALEGGEWSASRPGRALFPGEWAPGTHCTGGWVGPRAGLEGRVGEKSSASLEDRTPVAQSVARQCTVTNLSYVI